MATPAVLQREEDFLVYSSIFDPPKGEKVKYRGNLIEKKIEFLEGLAGKVSNRRARRWVNDRLLIELVPRLDAEEIRGLFAPPPWGDNVPLSPFCMTNTEEWDAFRSVDMDKEVCMINALKNSSSKRKDRVDADKMAAVDAWRRVDCRTREALRRSYLPELIASYEECIRAFIKDGGDEDDLVLQIQDPFHRLLLHGVCEFYDLVSVTIAGSKGGKALKTTRIKKKKSGSAALPNITLTHFLKMSKAGIW
ncbi:R3H domain-containing protein 4-like isoform X1 [Macadamia integrifolia]|uniref:R3H domain-containing protein 4-like isoform X1 n=1 Tax=Macadamia integrifolia TaxID=60698 RepID=UPI001C4F1155|nr:R3H domain-containing protein 4-like isoform X1 [Macadamia integrifolia]